jgi:hypothetical protein
MRRLSALAAVMLCGLALAACDRFAGKDAAGDKAFGERVRAYLLQHPEVLQEVAEKYRDKQLAEQAALERKARADLPKYRQARHPDLDRGPARGERPHRRHPGPVHRPRPRRHAGVHHRRRHRAGRGHGRRERRHPAHSRPLRRDGLGGADRT